MLFNGMVTEIGNTANASYVLTDNEYFYDIGFKVMSNQENSSLIRCSRLKYNGKVKLVYATSEYTNLAQKMTEADVDSAGVIAANLMEAVVQIENVGFLEVACIDTRMDRIYVDNHTHLVKFLYLPLTMEMGQKTKGNFESEIRTLLVRNIARMPYAAQPAIKKMIDTLMDGTVKLAELARAILTTTVPMPHDPPSVPQNINMQPNQRITLQSADSGIVFDISSEREFLIGKSAERVNGVISGNPAISRVHCKVFYGNDIFQVIDMGSSNGTFVDGNRIDTLNPVHITIGSHVRVANMEFIVRG